VVAFPFQMRVDDQFLARADDWRKHQPDDREMSGAEAICRLVVASFKANTRTSRPSQSKRGVERLKLDASVLRGELPIGLGVFLVAIGLPSGDLTLEESLIRHPAIEALG